MLKLEDFAMKTFGKLLSTHNKKLLAVTQRFELLFEPKYELHDVDLLKKLQRGTKIRIVMKLRRGFWEGSRRFQVLGLVLNESSGFN